MVAGYHDGDFGSDGTGRLKGTYWPDLNSRSPLHLADVNGDNVADIMVNGVAYDAKNDAELFSPPLDIAVESSIVRDIDQDGTPEDWPIRIPMMDNWNGRLGAAHH